MKKVILIAGSSLILVSNAYAGDTSFMEGKKLFKENCLTCHSAQLDPPLAPPMFAVQMKYKMATPDKSTFVNKVTSFATHPTKEKALLDMAVNKLGLMPEMGFSKKDVRQIAAYIHDETFSPPCKHWEAVLKMERDGGDMQHYKKVKKRYKMMCSSEDKAVMKHHNMSAHLPDQAEEGTLKAVMQQLGKDHVSLNQAILMEDFAGAAKAANDIANHGKPSMFQKMKIMAGLRMDMSKFKKADGKVHNLALDIEKAAKAKNMKTLITKQSQMLKACMACHTTYRSRVIEMLK